MPTTQPSSTAHPTPANDVSNTVSNVVIECRSPITGERFAEMPVDDARAVQAAVARARVAQEAYAKASFADRRKVLRSILAAVVENADAKTAIKNGRPLKQASIQVQKSPDQAGCYSAKVELVPHIHFKVKSRDFGELTSQVLIDGEAGNGSDFVLRSIRNEADRRRVLMTLKPAPPDSTAKLVTDFEIVVG